MSELDRLDPLRPAYPLRRPHRDEQRRREGERSTDEPGAGERPAQDDPGEDPREDPATGVDEYA